MVFLIQSMHVGIVGLLVREHAKEDLEQPLPQAPERAGTAHALLALFLVVGLAPRTGLAKTVCPQMDGVAHEFVAGPADVCFVNLPGLVIDRGRPGEALQHLRAAVAIGIAANGRQ